MGNKEIIFRTDASVNIGTGHVIRCLNLASAFRRDGYDCRFVCREQQGDLIDYIKESGFKVSRLAGTSKKIEAYSGKNCIETEWEKDAEETLSCIDCENVQLLIVDSYSLDEKWENEFKKLNFKIMVIDDLANRNHCCDILLDQTGGRQEADYAYLVPSDCILLLGPDYSILNPRFSIFRPYSITKRKSCIEIKNILVFFGGSDPLNACGKVLRYMDDLNLKNISVNMITGLINERYEELAKFKFKNNSQLKVMKNVSNMHELMYDADLAIGAPGTISWERCTMGLPSLLTVIAENQQSNAAYLKKVKAAEIFSLESRESFAQSFNLIKNSYSEYYKVNLNIADGMGIYRTLNYISIKLFNKNRLSVRKAVSDDIKMLFEWQNNPGTRKFFRDPDPINWADHKVWFENSLNDSKKMILFFELNNEAVSYVRLDWEELSLAEVSIIVKPGKHGENIGSNSLSEVMKMFPELTLKAYIKPENIASRKCFAKAGFIENESNYFYLNV